MNNCKDCVFWHSDEETTYWNRQHQNYLSFPVNEFGECQSEKMKQHTFTGTELFENYTHMLFGCVFFSAK